MLASRESLNRLPSDFRMIFGCCFTYFHDRRVVFRYLSLILPSMFGSDQQTASCQRQVTLHQCVSQVIRQCMFWPLSSNTLISEKVLLKSNLWLCYASLRYARVAMPFVSYIIPLSACINPHAPLWAFVSIGGGRWLTLAQLCLAVLWWVRWHVATRPPQSCNELFYMPRRTWWDAWLGRE